MVKIFGHFQSLFFSIFLPVLLEVASAVRDGEEDIKGQLHPETESSFAYGELVSTVVTAAASWAGEIQLLFCYLKVPKTINRTEEDGVTYNYIMLSLSINYKPV